MGLSIELAIAKTNKYASRESGDTAEVVERPGGGISVVVADGQGSGRAAKTLSLLVTSKAVAMLKEGVRDGAVARGVHDYLFAYRHGQVSATLDILSVDLRAETVLVTRNAATPLLIDRGDGFEVVPGEAGPIGLYPLMRPAVTRLPMTAGVRVLLCTDGIAGAGGRLAGQAFDLPAFATGWPRDAGPQAIVDAVLDEAVRRDDGRPMDDMTVVALALQDHDEVPLVRRLSVTVPLP